MKKYTTYIKIKCLAEDKDEAFHKVGEYLRGNLTPDMHMKLKARTTRLNGIFKLSLFGLVFFALFMSIVVK